MTAMSVSSGIGVLLLLLRPADTLWQPHAVFSRSVPPRHCRTTARAASTITSGNNTMAAGCTDAPARAAAEAETIASRSPSVPPAREPRDPRPPLTLAWSLVDGDPRHARLAPPAPHVSFGSLAAARDALAAVLLDERALAELAATQPPPTRVCGARVLRLDALLTCAETTTDGGTAEAAISWLQAQEGADSSYTGQTDAPATQRLPRVLWATPSRALVAATVGAARSFARAGADDGRADGDAFDAARAACASAAAELPAISRYYGGVAFDVFSGGEGVGRASPWAPFGESLFVLPAVELLQTKHDGETRSAHAAAMATTTALAVHLCWRDAVDDGRAHDDDCGGDADGDATFGAERVAPASSLAAAAAAAHAVLLTVREAPNGTPRAPRALPAPATMSDVLSRPQWRTGVEEALATIGGGALEKIVLARAVELEFRAVPPRVAAQPRTPEPPRALELLTTLEARGRAVRAACAAADGVDEAAGTAAALDAAHRAAGFLFGMQLPAAGASGGAGAPATTVSFVGASPERLFAARDGRVELEAVAGTRPRAPGDAARDAALADELLASEKDLRENAVVADFIAAALDDLVASDEGIPPRRASLARAPEFGPPRVLRTPRVMHLRAAAHAPLAHGARAASVAPHLLRRLHPTPAVCGRGGGGVRGVAAAAAQISRSEGFDRGWYAGVVGAVARDDVEFTVAIRSALVAETAAEPATEPATAAGATVVTAYAGAGLVAGSDEASEWRECGAKLEGVVSLFGNSTVVDDPARVARKGLRVRAPLAQPPPARWVSTSASVVVAAPAAATFEAFLELERVPEWAPMVASVTPQGGGEQVSTWRMGFRGVGLSWTARIVDVEPPRLLRWRADDAKAAWAGGGGSGVMNRGVVRFTPLPPPLACSEDASGDDGPLLPLPRSYRGERCLLELEMAFEIPQSIERLGLMDSSAIASELIGRVSTAALTRFAGRVGANASAATVAEDGE